MTSFDDPNREAVGLTPIWTGASAGTAAFDPSEHTVAEVSEYLDANPDDRDRVLQAEADGKARSTLLGGDEA